MRDILDASLARLHDKSDFRIVVPLELLRQAAQNKANIQYCSRLNRRDFTFGWRHRNYEYYAGHRQRAHA